MDPFNLFKSVQFSIKILIIIDVENALEASD